MRPHLRRIANKSAQVSLIDRLPFAGKWRNRSNFGRGRVLLPSPRFHFSVADRLAASAATLLEHGGGNNENVPETKGYRIRAHFLPGQSMKDVTFVE